YVVGYPKGTLTDVGSFTATSGNNRQMTLTWTFPQDARVTEVIIVRNTGTYATNIGSGTQIFRGTTTQTIATYTETLENIGIVSYYTAFASDGGANYSSPVFAQATATDTTPPGLVGSFTIKGEFRKAILSWTNPEDKDFARVEIIRNLYHFPQTPTDGMPFYKDMGTATTDEGLLLDQIYYYTAFSCDGINYSLATITIQGSITSTKDTSPPLDIGTITEGYEEGDIDRDVGTTGSYWVNWSVGSDTESGITCYELQEKKNEDTWKTVSDNIIDTYYSITGKEIGNTYYYQVRAKNGADIWDSWSTTSDGIRIATMYFNLSEHIGTISFTTGTEKIEVYAPGNAFEGTTTFTIINLFSLPVTNFGQATPKIKKAISSAWQLGAINMDNKEQIPTTTLTIFITYPDTGFSPEDETKLRIYRLNKNNNCWEMIPGVPIISDNLIMATITTLSTFIVALPSSPASALSNVKVYPNPFKPSKGHYKITFEGLRDDVKIKIYKITGELVYENDYSSTDGYEDWNATNSYGEELASGVYIYVIEGGSTSGSGGEKAIGKIAIIR
ncbi:MAG: gliding motility-associated C-terminal domain-containing protein, partial [Nitrospirota bacterium]